MAGQEAVDAVCVYACVCVYVCVCTYLYGGCTMLMTVS